MNCVKFPSSPVTPPLHKPLPFETRHFDSPTNVLLNFYLWLSLDKPTSSEFTVRQTFLERKCILVLKCPLIRRQITHQREGQIFIWPFVSQTSVSADENRTSLRERKRFFFCWAWTARLLLGVDFFHRMEAGALHFCSCLVLADIWNLWR